MRLFELILLVLIAITLVFGVPLSLLLLFPPEDVSKPRLVGYGCVYRVSSDPVEYMFVEGPTYADEEDQFPECVKIESND